MVRLSLILGQCDYKARSRKRLANRAWRILDTCDIDPYDNITKTGNGDYILTNTALNALLLAMNGRRPLVRIMRSATIGYEEFERIYTAARIKRGLRFPF